MSKTKIIKGKYMIIKINSVYMEYIKVMEYLVCMFVNKY